MKIKTGKYIEQISFGITLTNYNKKYKALIIDFCFWYIEFVVSDYKNR